MQATCPSTLLAEGRTSQFRVRRRRPSATSECLKAHGAVRREEVAGGSRGARTSRCRALVALGTQVAGTARSQGPPDNLLSRPVGSHRERTIVSRPTWRATPGGASCAR
jgi:hypothetical protein